ncbi:MAG: hypothetical protein H7281_01995 [Bacteriovorax sp.]|nr:hypothetical protein [Bacteriovorax sp.]
MESQQKPLPTKVKMFLSIGTLLAILLAFNQCVFKPSVSNKKSTSTYGSTSIPAPGTGDAGDPNPNLPEGLPMPGMNAPVSETELSTLNVGVKNFEQINVTMSQLTGVPVSDANIVTVFNDIAIQLPSDNSVKSFLPSMQVAITKLATEYCDRLVETDAYRKVIWTTINFDQSPTQTLTAINKTTMINQTVERFLGPVATVSIDSAKTELLSLYDIMIAGESLTTNLTTRKVVKGICVASLSSAYVTLL